MESLINPNPPSKMYLVAVPDPMVKGHWIIARSLLNEDEALKVFWWYAEQRHAKLFEMPLGEAIEILDSKDEPVDDDTEELEEDD